MKISYILVALAALGSGGCMSASALIKEMGKDEATVCASYVGIYGNIQVSRTKLENGTVSCSKDGLAVRSGPVTLP